MKLPETVELSINGKEISCVEIKTTEVRRSAPTILPILLRENKFCFMYKDRFYLPLTTWANIKFNVHASDAYFYTDRDTKKRELRVIIDHPNGIPKEGLNKLQDYNEVVIESGLEPEYENPFIVIKICD